VKTFESFLNDHKNVPGETNGRTAVIVSTDGRIGVQFWTADDIKKAYSINTDKTKSTMITTLKFARWTNNNQNKE
jgi:hypothetical protein